MAAFDPLHPNKVRRARAATLARVGLSAAKIKTLKDYSEKDIAYLLETGNTPDGDSVGGPMAPVIRNTSQLVAADRDAMAAYIKSLPPVEGPKKPEKK